MKPYPAYKDSGVEWIGDVPEHWDGKRLKYWLTLISDKSVDRSADQIALENIESWTGKYLDTASEFSGDGVAFKQNDILFGKLRPYLAKVWLAEFDGNAVGDIFVYRTNEEIVPRFAFYRFISKNFIDIVNGSTFGAKMPRASSEFIGNLIFFVPPLAEQTAIAAYLDQKTAQIDTLIEKKRRLIGLLIEERTAIISQAVTKGLNPAAPMKDSGVEWIGNTPEDWKVLRLGYVAEISNGSTPGTDKSDYWENGSIPWLASEKVNDYFVQTPSELITEKALKECSVSVYPAGTVILGMVGQGKTRGMSAYMKINACINQNLAGIVPSQNLNGRYLHHFLTGSYEWIREYGRGANQAALNCELVSSFRIPLPPLEEQAAIAAYLDQKIAQIDRTIAHTERQIELLQEYRTALISSVVTGKIDVREEIAS